MKMKNIYNNKTYLVIVLIPLLLSIFYYTIFSADRFVSESYISVKSSNESQQNLSNFNVLGLQSSSKEDTLYLKEYINSLDMFKILEKRIHIKDMYKKEQKDIFFSFYDYYPEYIQLWYFKNHVNLTYDELSGLLKIKVDSFDKDDSYKILKTILEESEYFLNNLSKNMFNAQMEFSKNELEKAKENYAIAGNNLVKFQNIHGLIDANSQIKSQSEIVSSLEAEISKKETEFITNITYLQENSIQMLTLQNEIIGLKKQLNKEKEKATNINKEAIVALNTEYQKLLFEKTFSEDVYKSALANYEKARIKSLEQMKYLSIVQQPFVPLDAEYPKRLYNMLTILLLLTILYYITNLFKNTLGDNQHA